MRGICYLCGKPFECESKSQKYCSVDCRKEAARRRYKARYVPGEQAKTLHCAYCGKEYQFSGRGCSYYCSLQCRERAGIERQRKERAARRVVCKRCGALIRRRGHEYCYMCRLHMKRQAAKNA